jgi:hypothetical protein
MIKNHLLAGFSTSFQLRIQLIVGLHKGKFILQMHMQKNVIKIQYKSSMVLRRKGKATL